MPTPGILFVVTKPKPEWPEDSFNTWYSTIHIQDVIAAGLADLAIRYKNTDPNAKWPYLAVYRLPDLSKFYDQEVLAKVPPKHEMIPGDKTWMESIEVEMGAFELVQKFEGQIPKDGPRGKALRTVLVEPSASGAHDAEFDKWYRTQHLDMLSMVNGYRRSTRYKADDVDATRKAGKPPFLALHEYDDKNFPREQVKLVVGTEWSKEVLGRSEKFEGDVWEVIAETGAVADKL